MTDAAAKAGRPARQRRERTATQSLLSAALGLEAVVMFFVMLTAFGLKAVSPGVAFGGGIGFIVALVLVSGLLRHQWGVWLGWALQAALIATGFLLPAMFFVAALFVGIWVFCFVKGRQLDRAKAAFISANNTKETP